MLTGGRKVRFHLGKRGRGPNSQVIIVFTQNQEKSGCTGHGLLRPKKKKRSKQGWPRGLMGMVGDKTGLPVKKGKDGRGPICTH